MIRKVTTSMLDRKYLALRSGQSSPASKSLANLVVNKPWGYEYLLTNNPIIEIWHLSLNYHKSTSTHCHPNKKTVLVVLKGQALFSTLNESIELSPFDAVIIDPAVFHSTQCLSKNGLKLLELETPPMKHDLVRLEDKYGRVNKGYEGSENMFPANKHHIRFSNNELDKIKTLHTNKISLISIESADQLKKLQNKQGLAVLVSGSIKRASNDGSSLYTVGDVVNIRELKKGNYGFVNASVLTLVRKT